MSGPIGAEVLRELPTPPLVGLPVAAQVLWFSLRQFGFVFRQRARLGDVSERPQHRNVTMIPARGGRVVMRRRRG